MKLAFREYGTGQPLLILHGLFGQSDNWNSLAKNFSENNFKVYTLDLRNHGLSPHREEWTYELMANDLKEFIDEHGLKDVILMGHSMGGKVALFFEMKFPEIAARLIIADMSARYYPPHHQKVISALKAVDFNVIKTRKDAEIILSEYLSDFGTKQFLLKNIYWMNDQKMNWRFNLETISKNIESIGIAVPPFSSSTKTLVIYGEQSDYVNKDDKLDFEKRFSNLTFNSIKNAGHWLHAEKPIEFFESVINFIKG